MRKTELKFSLKLEADFHVGTGYGEKAVADSRQMTDPQGRPMVPKRQFRGLLRDRLEYLGKLYPALSLCDGEYTGNGKRLCRVNFPGHTTPDAMPCPLCRIFGSVATERGFEFADVRVADRALLPEDRMAALAQREMVSKAHVTIDRDKRRAKGDHLFGIEVARPAAELKSCITSSPIYEQYESESDSTAVLHHDTVLLVAALRFLRRVGAKRKRGLGRCVVVFGADPIPPIGRAWDEVLEQDFRAVLQGALLPAPGVAGGAAQ